MFVNAAFSELLDSDASSWIGRPLSALSSPALLDFSPGKTQRFDVVLDDERHMPMALSIAAVPGPGGKPFCLLCSLVDARGDGAPEAIQRDAGMLAQVARAAGELMSEATAAARFSRSDGGDDAAGELAMEAMARTVHAAHGRSS